MDRLGICTYCGKTIPDFPTSFYCGARCLRMAQLTDAEERGDEPLVTVLRGVIAQIDERAVARKG